MSRAPSNSATKRVLGHCASWFRQQWLKINTNRVYSEVEAKVKPLVSKLNATGVINTVASCQGHFYGKPPYVYFNTSTEIARAIERRLREAAMSDEPGLTTSWVVYGVFNENYELTFLLHSPEYHNKSKSLFWPVWFFGLMRRRLDAELLMLASVVEQAVLLEIGDDYKP